MCAIGRREGGGREVLVLVVADEPRGTQKYGSRVAGPTAVRILEEALGRTRNGERVVGDLAPGFAPSREPSSPAWQQPWREVDW
jgi:hypothetical protein